VEDSLAAAYAYHVAVYLPDQAPRFIGMDYGEALKRIALPLRAQVIPLELQPAYDDAYQVARMAVHIEDETQYSADSLPFRSLISEVQYQQALEAVKTWQEKLAQLK
jgi:hypothetical protein